MAEVQVKNEASMCVSDMNILKTRALEHSRDVPSPNADKMKKATRKKVESVMKCREHHEADASPRCGQLQIQFVISVLSIPCFTMWNMVSYHGLLL